MAKNDSQKVAVRLWRDLVPRLEARAESACLRRDAWLSKVIKIELGRLEELLPNCNSEIGERFIANQLDFLDRKQATLTLDAAVAERLNDVCRSRRIVRDAFINRLIFLLVAGQEVLDRILGEPLWESEVRESRLNMTNSNGDWLYPMGESLREAIVDPLAALHDWYALRKTQLLPSSVVPTPNSITEEFPHLYSFVLSDRFLKGLNLWGLNVFLHDYDIPGTAAQRELDGEWELTT